MLKVIRCACESNCEL